VEKHQSPINQGLKMKIKAIYDYGNGAKKADPINQLYQATIVSIMSNGKCRELAKVTEEITFHKEDPVINHLIGIINDGDKENDFALIFSGLQNGIIIVEV
jgi:hypothetical protein